MVSGLHQVQGRDVGLGLGGEVGAGDQFDLAPGAGLAFGDGLEPGQGGGAEIHDVAAVRPQADFFQQGPIVQQGLGMGLKPAAHFGPMQTVAQVRRRCVRFRRFEEVQ